MSFHDSFFDIVGDLFGGGTTGGGGGVPAIDFNRLTNQGPLLISLLDRTRFQEDPVRRGILQRQIDNSNFTNRYNPNFGRDQGEGIGPQFNLGNPIGDALSGFGGAFGFDELGNPLTAGGGLLEYLAGQIGSPTNISTQRIDSANALGNLQGPSFTSGITGQALDTGGRQSFSTDPTVNDVRGINPDFQARGIPQGGRPIPQPLPDLPQTGGTENAILEGLLRYIGVPLPETAPSGSIREGGGRDPVPDPFQAQGPPPGGFNVIDGQRVPSLAHGITSVPQDGLADLHKGEAIVPAELNPLAGTAPQPFTPEVRPLPRQGQQTPFQQPAQPLPALAPTGAEALFAPLRNTINDETAGLLRSNRNAAGALGSVNTGEFRGSQRDIQQGRINQLSDARQQAGQQFFGQNAQENEFAAGRFDANRQFAFDVERFGYDVALQNQSRNDDIFNLFLQLGFTAEELANSGISDSLLAPPVQAPIPITNV